MPRLPLALALAAACFALPTAADAVTLPTGYEERSVAAGLTKPTDAVWAPDGRLFVAQQGGVVRVVAADGTLAPQPLIDISGHVNSFGDRGLLGIEVDADFEENGYLYLLYVYETNPLDPTGRKTSRLTRITVGPDNSVTPETVILGSHPFQPCPPADNVTDCIPADYHFHAIGTVRSDPRDGTLWVGSGDASAHPPNDNNFRAYDERLLAGKLMHVDRQGRGLPGHPFCPTDSDLTHTCTKLHAKGFRNPFRFQLRPTGRVAVGDVGWNTREEIDFVEPGKSYGWPCYEGSVRTPSINTDTRCQTEYAKEGTAGAHTGPDWECAHDGCGSVTAGPTYTGDALPVEWQGDMFFGDYVTGHIRRMEFASGDQIAQVHLFATDAYGVVDLEQAPGGELAYVDFGAGDPGAGSVGLIRKSGSNRRPTAVAQAQPTYGAAPLTVQFDGRGSTDPDGDTLTYRWSFGDGSADTTAATAAHVYPDGTANSTATLTVTDGHGGTDSKSVVISPGNHPPTATLTGPATFRAGEQVSLQASATDPEQGALPGSSLSWSIRLRHGSHVHPLSVSAGGTATFTALDDHDADSSYEVTLTATDARGLTDVERTTIRPETRRLTIDTVPTGGQVTYDGVTRTAPFATDAAIGFKTTISAAERLRSGGHLWEFDSWSDGGARTHSITVPATDSRLEARYRETALIGEALLVVQDAAQLGSGDAALKARLESIGYLVAVRSQTVSGLEAAGKDVVVVSATVASTAVNTKFRDVAVPVVVAEAWIFDDMKMTGAAATEFGESAAQTSLAISDTAHPLAAGLSGTPLVSTSSNYMWGKPAPGAVKAATLTGDATRAAVFGYDTGQAMSGMNAPARRVGLFVYNTTATGLTADGWKLFDAAIHWAAQLSPPPPEPLRQALLVAASTTLGAGDLAQRQRLESLGYEVTVRAAAAATSADAVGKDVVLVSATVTSTAVNTKFRDSAVPVVVSEGWIFDDMGMTGATGFGFQTGLTSLAIAAPAHPMAAGLTGTPLVTSTASTFMWGNPGSTAERIATVPGDSSRVGVFGYESGAVLPGGFAAPARRVGLFLHETTAGSLTADGWKLFDAAIGWAGDTGGEPPPPPPPKALLVVDTAAASAGDTALRNRLAGDGIDVTVVDDAAVTTGDAGAHDVVVVSPTVVSSRIAAKFRDVTAPVLVSEAWILDDMQMAGATAATDYGETPGQTALAIAAAAHPLAAGLSGTPAISSSSSYMWGRPPASASKVATLTGDATKVAVFGYDAGQAMVGMNAPARRAGLFLHNTTATGLTADGWKLFDAAVDWALAG